jgi:hypothetical protein
MTFRPEEPNRRRMLQSVLGLALSGTLVNPPGRPEPVSFTFPPSHRTGNGKKGEFNFLAGEWRISHRQLKNWAGTEWTEYKGEATGWNILTGAGSVEELRFPATGFVGMGLRLLDLEQKVWNDFWVSGTSGVLTTPGSPGGFENGVGTFVSDDTMDDGKTMRVKGVWDRITPDAHRWWQSFSVDGGKTWKDTWFMDWVRAPGS